jgi:hypothetical protein
LDAAALAIAASRAPQYAKTLDLASLESLSDFNPKKIEEPAIPANAPTVDDVDEQLAREEAGLSGRRAKQLSGSAGGGLVAEYVEAHRIALGILRSGTFLSAQVKMEGILAGVDFAMVMANALLDLPEDLLRQLEEEIEEPERKSSLAKLKALLVIISNAVIANWGSAGHLEESLVGAFSKERDSGRRMVILAWLASLKGGSLKGLVDSFLAKDPDYSLLLILEGWLYAIFVMDGIIEGRANRALGEALRKVSSVRSSRAQSGPRKKEIGNQTADDVVRNAERKIRQGT